MKKCLQSQFIHTFSFVSLATIWGRWLHHHNGLHNSILSFCFIFTWTQVLRTFYTFWIQLFDLFEIHKHNVCKHINILESISAIIPQMFVIRKANKRWQNTAIIDCIKSTTMSLIGIHFESASITFNRILCKWLNGATTSVGRIRNGWVIIAMQYNIVNKWFTH